MIYRIWYAKTSIILYNYACMFVLLLIKPVFQRTGILDYWCRL